MQGDADIRRADMAVGEWGSANGAEAALGAVRTREHAWRPQPFHLVRRETKESHKGAAGGFLAHPAVTDTGPVPRAASAIAGATALAPTFEQHDGGALPTRLLRRIRRRGRCARCQGRAGSLR